MVVLVALAPGCDISVKPFAGTILQMSVSQNVTPSPPGSHLELWARTLYDDIVRINPENADRAFVETFTFGRTPQPFPDGRPGLKIVKAITMGDPCVIDAHGNLLTTADAYPSVVTVNGVEQTPEEQAAQVRNRIAQLTPTTECDAFGHCGGEPGNQLLAVVPWDETPAPSFATPPTASARLAACQAYWAESPLSYTPNPAQITAPLHGTVYGFVAFQTTAPPAGYDGFRLDTPVRLQGLRELFMTVEGTAVDPGARGPLFLQGVPDRGGREFVHIDLRGPTASGSAALLVNIDQDPVAF